MKSGLQQLLEELRSTPPGSVHRYPVNPDQQTIGPSPTETYPLTNRFEMSLSGPLGELNEASRKNYNIGVGDFTPLYLADRYAQGPVDAVRQSVTAKSIDPAIKYGHELPSMLTEDAILLAMTAPGKLTKKVGKHIGSKVMEGARRMGRILTSDLHPTEDVEDDKPNPGKDIK